MCLYSKIRFSSKGKRLYIQGAILAALFITTFYVPLVLWATARYEEYSMTEFESVISQNQEWEKRPFVDIKVAYGDA